MNHHISMLSMPSSPPTSMLWPKGNNDEQVAVIEAELKEWFKKSGALSQIKAQLRAKLIRELSRSTGMSIKDGVGGCQHGSSVGGYGSTPLGLKEQLLRWIIVYYMKAFGLVQSLSVFLPESGLPEHHMPKPEDIMEGLGLFPPPLAGYDSTRENYCLHSDSTSLLCAVVEMARSKVTVGLSHTDKEVQTTCAKSIGERLLGKEEWQHKSREDTTSALNPSAILFAHHRECESRANLWAKEELEMFKSRELVAVQAASAAKYRNKLEAVRWEAAAESAERKRRQYEDEILLRRKLEEKERYYEDSICRMKEEMREELHTLRLKEEQTRRDYDLLQRTAKLDAQKVKKEATAIEERSRKIDQRDAELNRKAEALEEKARHEARRNVRLEAEAVARDRDFISAEAEALARERKVLQDRLTENKRREAECHELRRDLEIEKKNRDALEIEIVHARQEIDTYREAYETGRPIQGYPNYPLPMEAEMARRLRCAEKGVKDLLSEREHLESVANKYKDERDEAESRFVIEVVAKEALGAEAVELRRLLARARSALRSIAEPGLGNIEATEDVILLQSNPVPCASVDDLREAFVEEWREVESATLPTIHQEEDAAAINNNISASAQRKQQARKEYLQMADQDHEEDDIA